MLVNQAWWYLPVIPGLGGGAQRQKDLCEFQDSLNYIAKHIF